MRSEPAVQPPVVILCGGAGTRLRAGSRSLPKPLVEVGDKPILWHVIQIFIAFGFAEFLLLTGHRGELVERFAASESWPPSVAVRCLETGIETPTGGRLRRGAETLTADTVCVAYADGVADIDLTGMVDGHHRRGLQATMAVVRPELPFGVAELDGDGTVLGFAEKPRSERWVNGGFFCFQRSVLEALSPDSVLERAPLAQLADAGQLGAFRHEGFWECMDTYKDAVVLNQLWATGRAPWKIWN